jgi:hypothetical protein
MQEDERSLLAGACACGSLRPDARTRVIPIHHHGRAYPPLRATRATSNLVSVPVRLQQRMLGEVDLFFRAAVHLSADESELLDAWPAIWQARSKACVLRRWSARLRWAKSGRCWRASCTTPSRSPWCS